MNIVIALFLSVSQKRFIDYFVYNRGDGENVRGIGDRVAGGSGDYVTGGSAGGGTNAANNPFCYLT